MSTGGIPCTKCMPVLPAWREKRLRLIWKNKQLLDILVKYAGDLPEKFSIIFIDHKLLDKPIEEVAKRLGVSTTYRRALYRPGDEYYA